MEASDKTLELTNNPWYTSFMATEAPTLSPAELERRRKAARSADAHLRLEGFTSSAAAQALKAQWMSGEINRETWLAELRALHNLSDPCF